MDREVAATCLWMARHLRIINRRSRLVPLIPNAEQQRLCWSMFAQKAAGFPIRTMVLKARRVGFSTFIEGLFFKLCQTQRYRKAFICAHDTEGSQSIFDMTRLMESELPAHMRRPKKASSRREIQWAGPHYSHIQVHTAGSKEVGRAKEISLLHCSEVAFWTNAKRALTALMQTVADAIDTAIVLETTANGVGGEFYDRWVESVNRLRRDPDDLRGFIPLFFGWHQFADYQRALPHGYAFGRLDEDEQALARLGCTAEQLYWRRCVLAEKCGSDVAVFKQEYPSTWEEAFQFSGRQAIPAEIQARHQSLCRPGRRVVLVERDGQVTAEPWPGYGLCWEVWHEPDPLDDYVVAGDVAEGALSDPMDETSDPDYSTGAVLNRRYLRIDATLHGRMDPDLHGYELHKAALLYNQAWVSPEINATGLASLAELRRRGCSKIYLRDGNYDRLADLPLANLGHRTTQANRDLLIDSWIAACRRDPIHGWQDRVEVYDERLASEEATFVVKANGKREHRSGAHDDLLFAAMIAWWIHLHVPRESRLPFSGRQTVDRPRRPAYVWSGGRDPGVGMEASPGVEVSR